MNLLAFDTSTEWMSMAVQRHGQAQPWQHHAAGGALTSTQLIPQILALMAQAALRFEELDALVFGAGPGSFTGLRSACAVAQGLAFGAGVPVLPVNTLMAVAEEARFQRQAGEGCRVLAMLDARMDEIYAQKFYFDSGQWLSDKGCRLIKPEDIDVTEVLDMGMLLAGNVFETYAARLPQSGRVHALPCATALLRLAPALLAGGGAVAAAQALPTYVRDKVAQTTQERAAIKAATASA
ncbi:MAG: tRNA (adenosine(37)-N6)-threonylcarbamoyltransferase complex dimerization subunit type 1 TsaB [Comamonadaceae bacterium]|nr:tRNA (adenosine(37)-N6)-threonylcarbamoyltransferase complex dimerization subunit type 1 TsaB [Comamonadaceae bacterium]